MPQEKDDIEEQQIGQIERMRSLRSSITLVSQVLDEFPDGIPFAEELEAWYGQ